MYKYKLGIIGAGNMSTAIQKGVLTSGLLAPNEIIVSDISISFLERAKDLGVQITTNNLDVAENAEYLLFAVKPQVFPDIAKELKGKLSETKVISIMAGVTIQSLKENLSAEKICRVMPNTPCMVGSGMSALCFEQYDDEEKQFPLSVFSGMGDIIELGEDKFDAVTSVSGSGPAYVYMFIDGMIKGGMNGGLSYEEAKKLTLQTVIGGARMIDSSSQPIEKLVDAVCSKGGTTIQAVTYYKSQGLTDMIAEGVDRCRARSIEMRTGGSDTFVRIYTDGACSGNPGPGGYAAILECNGSEKVISGGEDNTTNNRMELLAVIEALRSLNKRCVVEIHSDSAYVVNAVNNDWLTSWKAHRFANVKNPDLWEKLIALLASHEVKFVKVKGHSDDEMNNRCDEIARNESQKRKMDS